MTTGRALDFNSLGSGWTAVDIAKLASALATLAVLLALRRWVRSPFAMPAALLAMWVTGALALRASGLPVPTRLVFPLTRIAHRLVAVLGCQLDATSSWPLLAHVPELLAVTIVALVSLVAKVSSIEVARQTSADLIVSFARTASQVSLRCRLAVSSAACRSAADVPWSRPAAQRAQVDCRCADPRLCRAREFRSARLDPGSDFWRPGLLPWIHILHGRPGASLRTARLARPCARHRHHDHLRALRLSSSARVGFVCACLLFAISYARADVVRRHASRAQFASNVDRSAGGAGAFARDR